VTFPGYIADYREPIPEDRPARVGMRRPLLLLTSMALALLACRVALAA
jgi:hypothetical protein